MTQLFNAGAKALAICFLLLISTPATLLSAAQGGKTTAAAGDSIDAMREEIRDHFGPVDIAAVADNWQKVEGATNALLENLIENPQAERAVLYLAIVPTLRNDRNKAIENLIQILRENLDSKSTDSKSSIALWGGSVGAALSGSRKASAGSNTTFAPGFKANAYIALGYLLNDKLGPRETLTDSDKEIALGFLDECVKAKHGRDNVVYCLKALSVAGEQRALEMMKHQQGFYQHQFENTTDLKTKIYLREALAVAKESIELFEKVRDENNNDLLLYFKAP